MKRICILAHNIRTGGGLTHLLEFASQFESRQFPNIELEIWGLKLIENKFTHFKRIKFQTIPFTQYWRIWWWFSFSFQKILNSRNYYSIFVPGGIFLGRHINVYILCQNLIPFTDSVINLYKYRIKYFKFLLMRKLMKFTFERHKNVIFLSKYAQKTVDNYVSLDKTYLIPHDINSNFFLSKKKNYRIQKKEISILYVSTLDFYKNQLFIINSLNKITERDGLTFKVEFVGESNSNYLKLINKTLKKKVLNNEYIIHGKKDRDQIIKMATNCDLALFSSNCENLPFILLEKMALALPLLVCNAGPNFDIAKNCALFYEHDNFNDFKNKLLKLINDRTLREDLSNQARPMAQNYQNQMFNNTLELLVK